MRKAAVENGADAVYFGLQSGLNARARAVNFSAEELPKLMAFLHARGVHGYLTLNTLVFGDELEEAQQLARRVAAAGVDAVLVQDLGLLRLLNRLCPGLPLHASTQMTLSSAECIREVESLGVCRVVLPRELSIDQIAAIRRQTGVELEAFVHGALCISYSGQCLASLAIGGRSANRGQCAQPCRLPYELVTDGKPQPPGATGGRGFLLSPHDLAAYDRLPELIAAGVSALKIEGRLKPAEYVASVTRHYRAVLDALSSHVGISGAYSVKGSGGLSQFSFDENGTVPLRNATEISGGLSQFSFDENGTVPFGSTTEISGGLSQFSFDENGTVPLRNATVIPWPVLSVAKGVFPQATTPSVPQGVPPKMADALGREEIAEMEVAFSRGFCHGWLDGVDHRTLVSGRSSAKRGSLLGEVRGVRGRRIVVELSAAVRRGDGVVFQGDRSRQAEQGGRVYEIFHKRPSASARQSTSAGQSTSARQSTSAEKMGVKKKGDLSQNAAQPAKEAAAGDLVELAFRYDAIDFSKIELGQKVWKTDDPRAARRLRKTFADGPPRRRVPIDLAVEAAVGSPLRVAVATAAGFACRVESPQTLPLAIKHPLSRETLAEQFGRLGDTPYQLRRLEAALDGRAMIPLSVLGKMRHEMIRLLDAAAAVPPPREIMAASALAAMRRRESAVRNEESVARNEK